MHRLPGAQSWGPAQLVAHICRPIRAHIYGSQSVIDGAHVPAALQVRVISVLFTQSCAPHTAPTGYVAHCPLPLQRPLVAQLATPRSMHTAAGSKLPAGTG